MKLKTDYLTNNIKFEKKHCAQVFGAHRLLLIESSFIWPWCATVLDFHEFKSPVLHIKYSIGLLKQTMKKTHLIYVQKDKNTSTLNGVIKKPLDSQVKFVNYHFSFI